MTKPFEQRRGIITELDKQQAIDLVLEVKKHPCLYQTNVGNHGRKSYLQEWEEVGKAMNMSVEVAREKWKNLRAVFLRHLKAERDNKRMKPYYLSDHIKFIEPYLAHSPRGGDDSTEQIIETETVYHAMDGSDRSSEVQDEFDIRDDDPFLIKVEESDPQPSKPKKRMLSHRETNKHSSGHQETVGSSDTVTAFLKSLTPELNEMNHDQFKTFKRKVLALIDDIMSTDY